MSHSGDSERSEDNTFRILLATDCHLGFEAKTKRAKDNDSVVAFEEILQLAHKNQVDFILLGGDLFHECKPTQRVLLECLTLLKKYCLGTRRIGIKFLSDPEEIFVQNCEKMVNYEDSNLNVSMPVFSIHGNHDNPSFENTGAMDLMMASSLINYFGKWSNLTELNIVPMIFQKGNSHIAIYGLGHINEQRLTRMMRRGQVNFVKPTIPNCFCILVIHQNRARHAENEFVDQERFPEWLDMIFWGHEHECKIQPEKVTSVFGGDYMVVQPGSSIATSLCESESVDKHVGLLLVRNKEFKLKPLKLQTVRPFIFQTLTLSELTEKGGCENTTAGVCEYVDDFIEHYAIPKSQKMLSGNENQPKEPLIRIKVVYDYAFQMFETAELTRKYNNLVANPKDMIIFKKALKTGEKRLKNDHTDDLTEELDECFKVDSSNVEEWTRTVQTRIKKYFEMSDTKLHVLSLSGLNEALNRCIVAGDDEAFEQVMEHQMKKSNEYLLANIAQDISTEGVLKELGKYHATRATKDGDDYDAKEVKNLLNDPNQRKGLKNAGDAFHNVVMVDDDTTATLPAAGRSRGRGSRAGATRARGTTRGKARGKNALNVSITPAKRNDNQQQLNFTRFMTSSSQRNTSISSAAAPLTQRKAAQFMDSDSD